MRLHGLKNECGCSDTYLKLEMAACMAACDLVGGRLSACLCGREVVHGELLIFSGL